ncbi:ATP-dependent DNA helicase RecG [Blautia liquoris]|uniref:ATP-dependent DNA helicase RecG n=1 Tax=Blautia liquoris TaxID=2779518 RepID=A0A7M2RL75_9FIRM|nr:ATP-dependent DNA helicase RecG [Blautia liquoris]QOV20754.1 ATP-dependent DNA helicase RecG [Blautia liquoris]
MKTEDSIRSLKGIGEKTEKLFNKLGVSTLGQLLHYYPRDYDSYGEPVLIRNMKINQKQSISAVLTKNPESKRLQAKTITTVILTDGGNRLALTWFNMPFLRNTLKKGGRYIFRGTIREKRGVIQMDQPEIFTDSVYEDVRGRLMPIYARTGGLSNKTISKTVRALLDEKLLETEYLPEDIRIRFQLSEINYSIEQIHFPDSLKSMEAARRRLVFDEFFFFLMMIARMKESKDSRKSNWKLNEVWTTEKVIENLPYQLTNAQLRVWNEIECDLKGHVRMSRLIQGDVGSGKTILAFLAMIMAASNGFQSALMVPTEVLARQHYESLVSLLESNGLSEYSPVLLTGSNTAKEKRRIYAQIAADETKMIIGTHALIQEKAEYPNLALVITDEQHRFGVSQREALSVKGELPHVMVMSATPIPRTLAIMLYGDLDISVLDELPAKRLPVKNCVVDTGYRRAAYQLMRQEVSRGHQVYIICPMVEESEGLDAANVTDYTKQMQQEFGADIVVEMLHGQMKPKIKDAIMQRFASGEIQILVSTTVVEVGVNVPNATVMLVENSERFGLAGLHQLRGRVGRGRYQSFCIFMHGDTNPETARRLEILNKSNDGFYIAEEDLKLRGPGDLFGIRQSGLMDFKLADIFQDASVLKEANQAVIDILAADEDLSLPEHRELITAIDRYSDRKLKEITI